MSPRGPRVTRGIIAPVTDSVGQPATVDADAADQELADLGIQLPEGAMLSLHRMIAGGQSEFIEEQAVVEFSVASVAQRFGGGRYIAYLRKPDPRASGRWNGAGTKRFQIAGPSRYGVADNTAAGTAPSSPPPLDLGKFMQTYGDMVQESVKRSIESQNLMQQMQLALLKSMTERAPDPNADLTKTLITALIGRPRDQALTIADVLALADKLATRTNPLTQLKDTMELLATTREFTGGGDGPGWTGLASRALDVIGTALEKRPAQLAPGAPVPVPAGDVEVAAVTTPMHPLFHWLAPQMPQLIRQAQLDHDPDTYAGLIVDLIQRDQWADVLAFVQQPDFLEQLLQTFPQLQTTSGTGTPVIAWFGELRDNVIERLIELLTPSAQDLVAELPPP